MVKQKGYFQTFGKRFCDGAEWLNKVVNMLCVIFLTMQILSITLMVIGRYIFRRVPIWSEQFSLFCLVWFAMLSISLSVKDDSHIRMEIIDGLVAERGKQWLEYFSYAINLIFAVLMIKEGMVVVNLAKTAVMSGFRISEAFLYLSLPVSGVCIAYMSLYCIVKKMGGRMDG